MNFPLVLHPLSVRRIAYNDSEHFIAAELAQRFMLKNDVVFDSGIVGVTDRRIKNPFIDIITHPNDPGYPLEFRKVAEKAKGLGMAVELNNSKILYKRSTAEVALELIHACKEAGCLMSVDSDTHALLELGNDDAVRPLLEQAGFPDSHLVNRDSDSAARFIAGRRALKREAWERRKKAD